MKLLFNTKTKSIVLYNKGKYYDMRNGNEMTIEGKLPTMLPYDKYTLSKPETIEGKLPTSLTSIPIDITNIDGKYQFGGYFPRYFWKGFAKLIKSIDIVKGS